MIREIIYAYGHPQIKAAHRTTFEVTKEDYVTERGDCIIGVKADKSVKDLSSEFKNALRDPFAVLVILLETSGKNREIVLATGAKNLSLTHPSSIVVRKSQHVDERTLAINSNKAAININRNMIKQLQKGEMLKMTLILITAREYLSNSLSQRNF